MSKFTDEDNELLKELFTDGSGYDPDALDDYVKRVNFHGGFDKDDRDAIINPSHYKTIPAGNYPDGIEYMDLCVFTLAHLKGVEAHLVGQILKYTLRVGKKDAKLQDAMKIQWYANFLVNHLERPNV